MKKLLIFLGAFAMMVMAPLAFAGNNCATGCNDAGCYGAGCGVKKSPWTYGAWLEAGIYANGHGSRTDYQGSYFGNGDFMNNVALSDFQMNQLWLYIAKEMDTRCGWDWGFRADFGYGTDMYLTQSQGIEFGATNFNHLNDRWGDGDYFASFPQLYAEIGYGNFGLKFGKFLSPIGHESVMSPERFFYSTSYAFGASPKTQTGLLASWQVNRCFDVFLGWTTGEDYTRPGEGWNWYANGSDERFITASNMGRGIHQTYGNSFYSEDNNAALLGFNYKLGKKLSIGYAALIGKDDRYYAWDDESREYYVHSFIVGFKPNRCWDYTFEWTMRNDCHKVDFFGLENHSGAYGINNELIYKLNPCWAFGLRGEWMHAYGFGVSDDGFEFTLGANWTPCKNILVRPEIRYDTWDEYDYYDDWNKGSQFSFGISGIIKF